MRVPLQIAITEADLLTLRNFVFKSSLIDRSPEEVTKFLVELCPNGVFTHRILHSFVAYIFPHDTPEVKDVIFVLYGLLDREGTGIADIADFAAGFTIFCGGNKSSKLAMGFKLFDEDGDDRLSRRGFWRFLRSFLSVLVSLSLASKELSTTSMEAMYEALDSGAAWTASQIFDYVSRTTVATDGLVSFEEFASWYSEGGGYKLAPWLELLDLQKFLSLSSNFEVTDRVDGQEVVPGQELEEESDDVDEEEEEEEEEGDDEDDDEEEEEEEEEEDDDDDEEDGASYYDYLADAEGIVDDYKDPSPNFQADESKYSYSDLDLLQFSRNEVMFSFSLPSIYENDGGSMSILEVTQRDAHFVRALTLETRLHQLDPDDVLAFFSEQVRKRSFS